MRATPYGIDGLEKSLSAQPSTLYFNSVFLHSMNARFNITASLLKSNLDLLNH
jgi:hypothetical protein